MSLYLGLMSGTSLDGVDAALVSLGGQRERPRSTELVNFVTVEYGDTFRELLARAVEDGAPGEICELDFELGRRFAVAASRALDEVGADTESLQAVGSHGQTVWHSPPADGEPGSTLQIGEPAVVAEELGVSVVADFRVRDVAAGGHGAPLNTVSFGKDSSIGYSSAQDGTIRQWYLAEDLAPGFIKKITPYNIVAFSLSPDGEKIAFTGEDKVRNEATGRVEKVYPLYIGELEENDIVNIEKRGGHREMAWGVTWAPDGRTIVTGGNDTRLLFRDVGDPYKRDKVLPGAGRIWDVEFSPDGRRVFVATENSKIFVYTK